MRIRLICASALLTVALPIGAGVTCAQGWAQYSNQPVPPGYGAPGVPNGAPGYAPVPGGYAPYGPPGYAPYGPPQAYPPNYPAYPGSYPAGPQGFVPPGMVPGMPVTRTPPMNMPPSVAPPTVVQPGGVPLGGEGKPGAPAGEKIGLPVGKAVPESLPSVGQPYVSGEAFLDSGEPMIRYVGPNKSGVLPPLRNALPERIEGDRFWFSAGYTTSFIRSEKLATPLATTGSTLDVHPAGIGQRSTAILIGDNVNFGMIQGIRLGAGLFGGDQKEWSIEWAGHYLFPTHVRYGTNSDGTGNPIIARPVFDTVRGFERSFIDAFPGAAAGGVAVDTRSQFFDTEANIAYHYRCNEQLRLDALFGFRYMRLAEELTVVDQLRSLRNNNLQFLGAFIRTGDMLSDYDNFSAVNQFYGLQVGSQIKWETERFFVSAFGKLGFGVNNQLVDVNGQTALNGSRVATGGILALPSNIGNHSRTTFGFVPESGFDIGIRLTPHVRLTAGYSYLLWTQVARPGAQLNRNVNPATVPTDNTFGRAVGAPSPTFNFTNETFWLHSFNFGVDFTF